MRAVLASAAGPAARTDRLTCAGVGSRNGRVFAITPVSSVTERAVDRLAGTRTSTPTGRSTVVHTVVAGSEVST